jgi:23S rRNA pseudouridine1911/1915/1917 synthase
VSEHAHLDEHGNPRIVERRFVVEEELDGLRLDHYLKRKIPRLSRTKLQAIIRTTLRRSTDRPLKPHSPVVAGEELVIRREAQAEPPCPRTFGVLLEDEHVMVVDKPAGLPMHASARFYFNTLTRVLSERYPDRELQICHRLDRETSGIVVVARGKPAAVRLKRQFENRRVAKTYLAVVHGVPAFSPRDDAGGGGDADLIDLPLALVEDPTALISIRMEVRAGGLPSRTRVRVLETCGAYSLVRCEPITGRQHQIRAHLAAIGHPIVGDKLYAHGDEAFAAYCDGGMTDDLLALFVLPRHALHAATIRFRHPETDEEIQVDSPLPADLRTFLDQARQDCAIGKTS